MNTLIRWDSFEIRNNKKIRRGEYAKICGCSVRTAFNDLDDLVNKGILKRVGTTGKYTYYTLKSNGQSKQDKHAKLLKKKAR